ncbi:hypothetical protein JCM10207_004664 [Rhodosporidiobolus poonsookiae]
MQRVLLLSLAASALGSPLYKRNSTGYPDLDAVGPTPQAAWTATYNAAKAAGKIPSFSPSTVTSSGSVSYGDGYNETAVCSWTLTGCEGKDGVFQVPNGTYGISFDDGPLAASPTLYTFLQQNNQTASHFFIGSNIISNLAIFQQAVASGGHLAVHTWSHPYMTTLTDEQVLGELGWTAQAIYDQTGFVPKFWRPPYGDADNRVRAIAKEVFGMTLVGWDADSNDWCLDDAGADTCGTEGPSSLDTLEAELTAWINGTQSPGKLGLEHELTTFSVQGFMNTFPLIASSGWTAGCIPDLLNQPWYLNAPRSSNSSIDPSIQIGIGPQSAVFTTSSSSTPTPVSTSSSAASLASEQAQKTTATAGNAAASLCSASSLLPLFLSSLLLALLEL